MCLGLYRLSQPSFWFDEAYTWHIVSGDWTTFWTETSHGHDCGGFVYSLGLRFWMMLFGGSESALRLPGVLCAAGLSLALLHVGKELHGLRAGLFTVLLGALHPEIIVWSRQARAYCLELFLTAVYLLVLLRYGRAHDRSQGVLLAAIGVLLCLTHVFGVFVVAGSAVYLLLLQRKPGAYDAAATNLFALWPVVAPLPLLAAWTFAMRTRIESNLNNFWILDSIGSSYWSLLRSLGVPVVFTVGCLAYGCVRVRTRRAPAPERRLLTAVGCAGMCVLLGPLVVSILSRGRHHFILPRYHYPALVLMFVTVGYYLARLPLKPALVVAIAICVAGLYLQSYEIERAYGNTGYDGGDTRDAAAYLAEHRRPNDTVLIVPHEERITARYYGIDGAATRTAGTFDDFDRVAEATKADPPPAPGSQKWVMIYRRRSDDDLQAFGMRDAPQMSFGSLRVVRLEPDSIR